MSKKISELDPIARLSGLEEVPARLGTLNYKIRLTDIVGLVTKDRIGLGGVDNTPDSGKPVSGPQQEVFDRKANLTDINLLSLAMTGKANVVHTHELSEVAGLTDALSGFGLSVGNLGNRVTVTEGYITELNTRINNIIIPTTFDISSVNGLTAIIQDHSSRIDNKTDAEHSYTANNIIGLSNFVETALAAKPYVKVGLSDW